MKRKVWAQAALPTHSHGLRDGALFWLIADRFSWPTWITAIVCSFMLIVWIGELVKTGTEEEALEVEFVETEDEKLNERE